MSSSLCNQDVLLTPEDFDNLREAVRLNAVKTDPVSKPFQSRYAARKIWLALERKLGELHRKNTNDALIRALLGTLKYQIGFNLLECEERSAGEIKLSEARECTRKIRLTREAVFHHIATLNQLGFINSEWARHDKAKDLLLEAQETYEAFKAQASQDQSEAPLDALALYAYVEKNWNLRTSTANPCDTVCLWSKFEDIHTHTLFFLAQVYKNLGEFSLAAKYCQRTLSRQLVGEAEFDRVEWALNAATLSQYYIQSEGEEKPNFHQARHCLASALTIITAEEQKISQPAALCAAEPTAEEKLQAEELKIKIQRCKADVFRCFAKFGLALLEYSKDLLLKADDVDHILLNAVDDHQDVWERFAGLHVGDNENQIAATHVMNFAGARDIFLKVLQWLNEAKRFYTLNDYCSDYIAIAEDTSRAYKHLIFFESDGQRKTKMHKRRVDLLSKLVDELSPSHYLDACRQILFELGEISNEMLDIKLDAIEDRSSGISTEHEALKVNLLVSQGVKYFWRFLDTFKDAEHKLPKRFSADALRTVVLAHFYIGRMHSKVLTSDVQEKLFHCKQSLDAYQWIVSYCEQDNVEGIATVESELEICRDLVKLLPAKMDRIRELLM